VLPQPLCLFRPVAQPLLIESILQKGVTLAPIAEECEMMFQVIDDKAPELAQIGPSEEMCAVCETRPTMAQCGCCEKPVGTCGACCILRHTEGRYEVHKPDETSETFDYVAKLEDYPQGLNCTL
jgi:hypothetical protein